MMLAWFVPSVLAALSTPLTARCPVVLSARPSVVPRHAAAVCEEGFLGGIKTFLVGTKPPEVTWPPAAAEGAGASVPAAPAAESAAAAEPPADAAGLEGVAAEPAHDDELPAAGEPGSGPAARPTEGLSEAPASPSAPPAPVAKDPLAGSAAEDEPAEELGDGASDREQPSRARELEKLETDAMAVADKSYRAARKQRYAQDWGESNPAATDWLRRDATELAWKERLRGEWNREDNAALDSSLRSSETVGADSDDWRVAEFDELMRKEQNWRKVAYQWWLKVWDAAGDDYLFEEGEEDDYGWPKTRIDGSPWPERPRPARRPAAGGRRRYAAYDEEYDDDDDEFGGYERGAYDEGGRRPRAPPRRALPPRREPREPSGYGEAAGARREARRYVDEEEEEEEWRGGSGRGGGEAAREARAGGGEAAREGRRGFGWFRRGGWRRAREEGGRAEGSSRTRERRRASGGREAGEEAEAAPSGGGGAHRSRIEYVEERLEALQLRVEGRVSELSAEAAELGARRAAAVKELREVIDEVEAAGEDTALLLQGKESGDSPMPAELRGRATRLKSLRRLTSELRERRLGVWDALDEAEGRLFEIEGARRTLERAGLPGLRRMVDDRGVTRALRTYLQRLL